MSKCYYSTSYMKNVPLPEVLRQCEERRLHHVELSAPHPLMPLNEVKDLLVEYRQKGFQLLTHNYFPPQGKSFVLNLASLNREIQALNKKLMRETLVLASAIEAPLYGIHMGYLSDAQEQADGMFRFNPNKNDYAQCLDTVGKFVTQMSSEFEEEGVALILENLFPSQKENFSLGCSWEQIGDVMSVVPKEVGLLLDLGHVNISADLMGFKKFSFIDKYLTKFGERLYEVHLSENEGKDDDHMPLKKDSWQLDVLQDIDSIAIDRNFNRIYCLEARNSSSFKPISMSMRWIEEKINQDIGVVKA